jgi:F-box and WD-40 domain protein CDC4
LQVLDFGASRDGVPDASRGRRIVVDARGQETEDVDAIAAAGATDADNGADD